MLVIHLGPHKTATTYLQNNFKQQRGELLKRGWLYPSVGVRTGAAHHDVAEGVRQFVAGSGPAVESMRAAARKAKARGLDVLLSAEGFRRWNGRQIGALADVFGEKRPRLVYVLRDPMDVLRSMWAQSVKLGGTEELPRFVARHMRDPSRSRLLNPMRDLRLHLRQDRGDLVVLRYDELKRRDVDIYAAFMREALQIEDAAPTAPSSNARPELELTEFLRLLSLTGGYVSREGRIDVGDAVSFLFSPDERRDISETIRRQGARALRTIEVSRDTAYYEDTEQTLAREIGAFLRPSFEGGRLFPSRAETWTFYSSQALMRVPEVRETVERAAARIRRSFVRVALMNSGYFTMVAGRRLRNAVSARLR